MSLLAEVAAAADSALRPHVVGEPGPGRFEGVPLQRDRAFVLEAVREGYELHYGSSRAFAGMDPDLRLLAGDALYALGLQRLADGGDLEAVGRLADLITLSARAQAEGRAADVDELWRAVARGLAQ